MSEQALVARGRPGAGAGVVADREDDLLVVGAGRGGRLPGTLWPSVSCYCLLRATCPVLAVSPPPLQVTLAAVHRRSAWCIRPDTGHVQRVFGTVSPDV
ncbi:universal stress protein [Streptomyces sp. NPDC004976]